MNFVIVQTQFEGFHNYPEAPEEVSFLRFPHRHMFHVTAEIEVVHTDRDLEIIMVKRAIDFYFAETDFGRTSCEEIALLLQEHLKLKYPLSGGFNRDRVVNIEVLEDGENGAKTVDPLMYQVIRFESLDAQVKEEKSIVPPVLQQNEKDISAIDIQSKNVEPVWYPVPIGGDTTYIAKIIEDVVKLDKQFGLDKDMDFTTSNLLFLSNALLGEAGELANFVKKIVRDGETEDMWKELDFEVVDVFIYLAKLIKLIKCDFDNAWDEKHEELRGRYNAGKKHLSYSDRPLHRGN